jgi:type I restriction enzyme S subunit
VSDLYELPNGWEWTKLDDFVKIKGGKRVPKGKKLTESVTPYPYIRVSDFNDFGSINLDNIQYVTEDIHNEIKNYTISKDNIYISIAGTIGKTGIVPNELDGANLTENAAKLVFDNSRYDKNYLLYFTNSIPFLEQIGLATKTVAMPKLAITRLKEVLIPLPPLSEQQRIVSKLDNLFEKIDKAIALHVKNMDEADVFMGSVLNDVFGELEDQYEKIQLGSIAKIIGGGTPSKKEKKYWENGTIKWATVGDMNVETIFDTELSITEKGLKESSSNIVPKEAIIIATRVGLGKVCYLDNDTAINQDLKGLLPLDDGLNIRFLFNFFKQIEKYIISNGTGATVKGVKLDFVKSIELPLPPLQIQQKVVKYLDEISEKIEKVKKVQKEKMDSLKALKASILDRAFRGEL